LGNNLGLKESRKLNGLVQTGIPTTTTNSPMPCQTAYRIDGKGWQAPLSIDPQDLERTGKGTLIAKGTPRFKEV